MIEQLVKKWLEEADEIDGWTKRETRWFSSLSQEEKNKWNRDQAKATGLRHCAGELRGKIA